jgi:hypothetical protein
MNKEFIPYEQALELKELGFGELCLFYYGDNQALRIYHQSEIYDDLVGAPLYQQAFRWFREKYGLYAEIFVDDNKTFGFYITSFIEEGRLDKPITRQFNTYDEAELGCVKQLIEIIDRKDEAYQ